MGDDADGATARLKAPELGENSLKGLGVEGAEALIDEESLHGDASGFSGDDVCQGEGQREGDVEGLPARERLGIAHHAGAEAVDHAQAEPAVAAPGRAGLIGDAHELVASR